jgi:hypothetical protein
MHMANAQRPQHFANGLGTIQLTFWLTVFENMGQQGKRNNLQPITDRPLDISAEKKWGLMSPLPLYNFDIGHDRFLPHSPVHHSTLYSLRYKQRPQI